MWLDLKEEQRLKTLETAAAALPELEILAEKLRLVHNALQSITGEYTPDDLLGAIFSKFCIGK